MKEQWRTYKEPTHEERRRWKIRSLELQELDAIRNLEQIRERLAQALANQHP